MAVAEQAGERLRRLGRSVNIRERLDFSCAIFDGQGGLVANAPHIPVHLGAMGETVRDLLRRIPEPPAHQAWLCNDPAAGGSHLPDLTVVRCVHHEGHRFFVANRAHHVDVGGLTPGSMPPHSTTLDQEGLVFRHLPLLEEGVLRDLRPFLKGCRDVDSVLADLEAQIAANNHAAETLCALGTGALIESWMGHLYRVAEEEVRALLKRMVCGRAEDHIDGIPLRLNLKREQDRLIVDFTGTGGPHPGNLNAPPAVLRAAVLYALRCLIGRDFPLNEGALSPVEIRVPENSILSPPPGAAIVGGNVETSQRITDLFLRAAGAQAASQGTMNNLTLGGGGWAYYETLGGGSGACAKGAGVSAVQVHMTNTRATDPEVLEARLPLALRRLSIRRGSGGEGHHPGGDGLIREIELLAPASASLLRTRRETGAPGLGKGGAGMPGEDSLFQDGAWSSWDGETCHLNKGDRIRIATPGGGAWSPQDS
jgi:5-oxoprolinase (ATP-hydrolysing)